MPNDSLYASFHRIFVCSIRYSLTRFFIYTLLTKFVVYLHYVIELCQSFKHNAIFEERTSIAIDSCWYGSQSNHTRTLSSRFLSSCVLGSSLWHCLSVWKSIELSFHWRVSLHLSTVYSSLSLSLLYFGLTFQWFVFFVFYSRKYVSLKKRLGFVSVDGHTAVIIDVQRVIIIFIKKLHSLFEPIKRRLLNDMNISGLSLYIPTESNTGCRQFIAFLWRLFCWQIETLSVRHFFVFFLLYWQKLKFSSLGWFSRSGKTPYSYPHITTLDTDNFHEIVLNSPKNVLVDYTLPCSYIESTHTHFTSHSHKRISWEFELKMCFFEGCGFCKRLWPVFVKFAEIIHHNQTLKNKLELAWMDCRRNDPPLYDFPFSSLSQIQFKPLLEIVV